MEINDDHLKELENEAIFVIREVAAQSGKNDIANISIRCAKPVYYDSCSKNNITGRLILIEEGTNETVAAGMIV